MLITAQEASKRLNEKRRETEEKIKKCYFRNPYSPSDTSIDEDYINARIEDSIKAGCEYFSIVCGTLTEYGFNKLREAGFYIIKDYPYPRWVNPRNEFNYDKCTRVCFSEKALQDSLNDISTHGLTGWEIMTKYV